jgi:acetolactate synthase-1/2/3 large subunit
MVLLLRDGELAQIAQFQETALGQKVCSELPDFDARAFCRAVGVEYLSMKTARDIDSSLRQAQDITRLRRPVVVDVAIDYSEKTYFTRGVVRTNLARLPWTDRARFVARALARKISG